MLGHGDCPSPFGHRARFLFGAKMIYLFPKIYVDISGHLDDTYLFVRVGKEEARGIGGAIQYKWQRVKKIMPGIYVSQKTPFYDFPEMFTELK